ncbi:hypothetical protein FAZ69_14280 [Trinickia terrae]|uniref:Uncharacterized protein n=2 Tax=Trinickia terrae TaxID=2571161 RepID=A0A4U1I5G3_9BURK|nr:hypothetical protein FAZ69_14280 [Trinickia terrae]
MMPTPSGAQESKTAPASSSEPKPVQTITPIFSQLIGFSLPTGFNPVDFEQTQGDNYIRESVLRGETVDRWTQMITVTGLKANPGMANEPPIELAKFIAGGFHRACPDTFAVTPFGEAKVDGYAGYVAVVRCGSVTDGPSSAHSETAIVFAIKGTTDFYSVQWAERGPVATGDLASEKNKWLDRLNQLTPVRICPIVPGEKAPYPSCQQSH